MEKKSDNLGIPNLTIRKVSVKSISAKECLKALHVVAPAGFKAAIRMPNANGDSQSDKLSPEKHYIN
jgi:hypothetical protein